MGLGKSLLRSQLRCRASTDGQTFPRLHESASLPGSHALYTEHSDVTDALFKTSNVGISEVLTNPKAADILKYLLITDQPARRPAKGALASKFRSREIVLAVYKPSNSAQVEIVKAWLQVILNIADLMSKPGVIKPEVCPPLVLISVTVRDCGSRDVSMLTSRSPVNSPRTALRLTSTSAPHMLKRKRKMSLPKSKPQKSADSLKSKPRGRK